MAEDDPLDDLASGRLRPHERYEAVEELGRRRTGDTVPPASWWQPFRRRARRAAISGIRRRAATARGEVFAPLVDVERRALVDAISLVGGVVVALVLAVWVCAAEPVPLAGAAVVAIALVQGTFAFARPNRAREQEARARPLDDPAVTVLPTVKLVNVALKRFTLSWPLDLALLLALSLAIDPALAGALVSAQYGWPGQLRSWAYLRRSRRRFGARLYIDAGDDDAEHHRFYRV
jgi:hypothetical protein